MKLKVEKPLGIVTGAFCEEGKQSFSLFINTDERNAQPSAYGSNVEADGSFAVYYDNDTEDLIEDKVILIPENEQEKEWLRRLHFELPAKNQLWIIFLPPEVYEK
jgi:hypothetical protein